MSNPNPSWPGAYPGGNPQPGYPQYPVAPHPHAAPVPATGYAPVAQPMPGAMPLPHPQQIAAPLPSQAHTYGQSVPAQPYYGQSLPQARPMPVPQQYAVPNSYQVPVAPQYAQPQQYATPVPYSQPMPVQPQVQPQAYAAPAPVQPQRPQPVPAQPAHVVPQAQAQPQSHPTTTANRPMPTSTMPRPLPVSAARPVPVNSASKPLVRAEPKTEGEEEKQLEERVVRGAPPWLVSGVVHMVLLIVLALIYYVKYEPPVIQVDAVWAEDIGVQLDDNKLDSALMEDLQLEKPAFSMDLVKAEDPFAAPPELPTVLDGISSTATEIQAPSIGLALTGREKGARQALLGKYGGTKLTEEAVIRGLDWLKKNQEDKGTWSLVGPYTNGAFNENRASATAMALIAFQGHGDTHKEGNYKREVAKGWNALLEMQDKDGNFVHEGFHNHRLYTQAQCTIAICELYGMTKDERFKKPAQLAIDYCLKAQAPEGGWRYEPRVDADTSVTGWFVIALQSALMAGLDVSSPQLEAIMRFLDSVAHEDGTRYAYKTNYPPTLTMTAEALLCRQYLGWKHKDPRLAAGVAHILANPIVWGAEGKDNSSYYWYYATQVAHHMEGDAWNKWNAVMREVIPNNQTQSGKEAGSWSPLEDAWAANQGGRLYQTCLCIYMLEVYYRHLPIYKWKQQ